MLKERLQEYYGQIPKEQDKFIVKKCLGYTEADEDKLFDAVVEECPRQFGFPDISKLQKAFKAVPPSNSSKTYYCSVCNICGARYMYTLPYCPVCWSSGKKVSDYSVLVSQEEIQDVIRFNKENCNSFSGVESCYDCKLKKKVYCKNYGRPNFFCSELRECECNACCVRMKKMNENLLETRKQKKEAQNGCENQVAGKRLDA